MTGFAAEKLMTAIGAKQPLSMKIPHLDLQRIDMKIGREHIAWAHGWRLAIAWVRPAAMGEFIAAPGRKPELGISLGQAR